MVVVVWHDWSRVHSSGIVLSHRTHPIRLFCICAVCVNLQLKGTPSYTLHTHFVNCIKYHKRLNILMHLDTMNKLRFIIWIRNERASADSISFCRIPANQGIKYYATRGWASVVSHGSVHKLHIKLLTISSTSFVWRPWRKRSHSFPSYCKHFSCVRLLIQIPIRSHQSQSNSKLIPVLHSPTNW